MLKRNKAKVTLTNASIDLKGTPGSIGADGKYEFINGTPLDEDVFNVKGVKVQLDAILVQTYQTDRYQLLVKAGGKWLAVAEAQSEDQFISQLEQDGLLTIVGPSPQEIERQMKADQERKEEEQAARARAEERSRIMRERRLREEGRHRSAA